MSYINALKRLLFVTAAGSVLVGTAHAATDAEISA